VSGRTRLDPAAILPSIFIIDERERVRSGTRITIPPKARKRTLRVRERRRAYRASDDGVAGDVEFTAVRELIPYGDGWLAPPAATSSPMDPLRSLEYVVVDVETTGTSHSGGDRVTEVAAVRLRGDGAIVEEFMTLVNPERPIPPPITRLTRITQTMVAHAPRFQDIAAGLYRVLNGAVFVAHNASFDWRFIRREMQRAGGDAPCARVLCTVRLARRVVPEVSHRSLDALQFFFDVHNEARHRAFGDARATTRIFRRLLDRVDEREIHCWEELEGLLARRKRGRRKRTAMPIGVAEC
jgi:DNA polymerase III epsilon subunit family exonuclease